MDINSVLALLRPEINQLKAYDNLRGQTDDEAIILDSNENIVSPTQSQTDSGCFRYPEIRPIQLIERLAKLYSVESNQIMLGRGSDDLIDVLIRAFCRANQDSILQTSPCFSMYSITASIQGANVIDVPLKETNDFAYDINELITNLSSDIKLIMLASPQSPTGNVLSRTDLIKLLKHATQQVIVIDEAYIEFSSSESAAQLISEFPNLIVLRTLSKAYGLANIRCGALLAQAAVIKKLRPVLTPYALSGLTVSVAYEALEPKNLARIQMINADLKKRKDLLISGLEQLSFVVKIYSSETNFVLLQVKSPRLLIEYLEKRNIYIRSYSPNGQLKDFVRISIGSFDEIETVLNCLKQFN